MRRALSALTVAVLTAGAVIVPAFVDDGATAEATTKVGVRTLLRQLDVKAETNAGYDRTKFRHWIDTADADVCNARYEVLIAEAVRKPSVSSSCKLSNGKWRSKYDGKVTTNPSTFDVDHMVPLAEAWGSGAKRWTAATRKAYANDLGYGASLIAVSASSNRAKGASEPGQWMPATRSYRCAYVKNWIAVKWRWDLAVDRAEKTALSNAITRHCASSSTTVTKPKRATVKLASSSGSSTSSSRAQADAAWNKPGPDLDCSDIRKKVRVYPPDYHRLDADGDGWGCESYG
ncbi:HNH endonuclease family protein [Demequina rhizosphaerae]|uniref:HNH endonuclease family protein n=1 Tax=Demequina rhizosphaerae TaxID=1638985 RepID=UPI0007811928|nr:HNH endonuclease family protein [Demequina rhizosphaerae]